uniref:Uncharacterized protein n=1 Tax=Leersia perrieri TaxID=77586 RepID=A0A0D9W3U4_9ORYZ
MRATAAVVARPPSSSMQVAEAAVARQPSPLMQAAGGHRRSAAFDLDADCRWSSSSSCPRPRCGLPWSSSHGFRRPRRGLLSSSSPGSRANAEGCPPLSAAGWPLALRCRPSANRPSRHRQPALRAPDGCLVRI